MNTAPVLPLIIPFAAGVILLISPQNKIWQKTLAFLTGLFMLLASFSLLSQVREHGILVYQMGNWPPPFGILLAVDTLGAVMVLLSSLVGLPVLIYAIFDIGPERMKGSFYSLLFFLFFGINGAFLTGDFFNLFVFFEVVLLSSYVLLVLGNKHKQTKAGFTYLCLNLFGSTLFLVGAGLLFGQLGTLNMADIAQKINFIEKKGLVSCVAIIFFLVFGLKSAMFPSLHMASLSLSCASYTVAALFAGLLTKVGVYSLFRAFGTIFVFDVQFFNTTLLLPLAGLTMLLGVWGAMVQYDIRDILAFHSISQVGYILMGLAIFSPLALAAGIFHMLHHSLIKSSLFLIGGGVHQIARTQNLKNWVVWRVPLRF